MKVWLKYQQKIASGEVLTPLTPTLGTPLVTVTLMLQRHFLFYYCFFKPWWNLTDIIQ